MFDCRRAEELLEFYVDNELDAVMTRAVSEHLDVCAGCSRKMQAICRQNELVAHAVKSVQPDTAGLRATIEAATIAKHNKLLQWSPVRIPVWAALGALAIILISASIYFAPKVFGPQDVSLFQAAGRDHIMCSHNADAPTWAHTQHAITEVEESFIGHRQRAPLTTANDYQLVRARICMLKGEKFLHLVYQDHDGREASLFVGGSNELTSGDQMVTQDGKIIEADHIDDLNIMGTRAGKHLLIATASDNKIATSLLLSAVSNFSS